MAAKKKVEPKPAISPERAAQIAADARSGTRWADLVAHGPACACGAFKPGSTVNSWGVTIPKGMCYRHGFVRYSRIAG